MSAAGTGMARYMAGIELEKEGLSGEELARRLGYKNAQAWWAAKSYYSKREQVFRERSQPRTAAAAAPAAILEGLPERVAVNPRGSIAVKATDRTEETGTVDIVFNPPRDIAAQLLAADRARRGMKALKVERAVVLGNIGRYDIDLRDGQINYEVRGQREAACFELSRKDTKAFMAELNELSMLLEEVVNEAG